MKVIRTGNKYQICSDSVQTYDQLPTATYTVEYDRDEGCYLTRIPDITVREKSYGVHLEKAGKVLSSFRDFHRSLGVILSGDKGIGKSMFAKIVCERALKEGYPVILVENSVPGLARYIDSVMQECVVLFDEFDKIFKSNSDKDDQAGLLSLFDGTSGGKKLYLVTCNELYSLNTYIVNRPGRFHYHFRFDYPLPDDIRAYLTDKLKPEYAGEIEKVVDFSRKTSLNYDCLRAIAFELNRGTDFAHAIADLNIMTTDQEEYRVYLYLDNGKSVHNFHYKTNLFDYDVGMTYIRFYDDDGCFALGAYFEKRKVIFDISKNDVIIPAEGIQIDRDNRNDDDDYFDDDEKPNENLKNVQPLYMTFKKAGMKNLHYMI